MMAMTTSSSISVNADRPRRVVNSDMGEISDDEDKVREYYPYLIACRWHQRKPHRSLIGSPFLIGIAMRPLSVASKHFVEDIGEIENRGHGFGLLQFDQPTGISPASRTGHVTTNRSP